MTIKAKVNSVERNKLKRTIREAFRHHREALGSYDYNVVVPGNKKPQHPYPIRLRKSLRQELARGLIASPTSR
jgi:ribonuclease P protein component